MLHYDFVKYLALIVNKLATFLCLLSTYTENCQFNISFNAPSSTGKSCDSLKNNSLLIPRK